MSTNCPHCSQDKLTILSSNKVIRIGQFYRHCDRSLVQRYRCKVCRKSFSDARFSFHYRQRLRNLTYPIFQLFSGGNSQRRTATFLRVNRKTIVRKYCQLGIFALTALPQTNKMLGVATKFEFDDMETFEHTKYKPLSITLAVEAPSRRILGFKIAQMPAKGLLVKKALEKYGLREDHRKLKRQELFNELKEIVSPTSVIRSDMNPHYESDVNAYFPDADYTQFRGRRGCVVGQGELKAGGFDPIFTLNHTCAMLRANINRLYRRTWCTTKIPKMLEYHIGIYSLYHNLCILDCKPTK